MNHREMLRKLIGIKEISVKNTNFDLQKVCMNNGVVFFTDFWGRNKFVGGGFSVAVGLDVCMWNHRSIDRVVVNPHEAINAVRQFKDELKSRKKKNTKGWKEAMSDCNRFLDTVGKNVNYKY